MTGGWVWKLWRFEPGLALAIFSGWKDGYRTTANLHLYRGGEAFKAGQSMTARIGAERCDQLYKMVEAYLALTGSEEGFPDQEFDLRPWHERELDQPN